MRTITGLAAIGLALTLAAPSFAESEIPDLKGTWEMNCSPVMNQKTAEGSSEKIHAEKLDLHDFRMTLVINMQEGFRFSGYIESSKRKESIVGVVGFDNKSIYLAAKYGFNQAILVSPDKMESVYLRISPHYSIAARVVITRKRR